MINIAFFGTSNFSKNIFLELISISKKNNYNLPITVSKQNKLNKKRNTKSFSLVCKISILNSILNYRPQIINNKTFYVFKKKTNILIIAGYGKILPKIFINKHIKLLNIHPSLLPKLKGPAPIQKSIQKNKKKTGISILKITPQIDNGDIYNQIKIKILTRDHHSYFLNRSSKIIKIIIKKIIPLIIENRIKKKYQKIKNSTYANFIKKQNGNICWNSYSKLILKKIQALSLWPKNFTFYKNKKILLFLKNTYISKYKYRKIPGLLLIQKNKLIISTKDSSIYFTKIQLESKKKINISNFINGYVIKNNNILLNYKK